MRTAFKKDSSEMVIDLKAYHMFADMKNGLEKKLASAGNLPIGSKVNLDIGPKKLSNKQLREIEDILLDYGLHLQELMSNGPPDNLGEVDDDDQLIENVPYYRETILITRHIRSGQKHFSEGNVVVLGDINPGAEVVARGNILVMGSMRGMAHAGAFGDESAIIAAYRLNPTQLRIAAHITRPPDGEKYIAEHPEIARIKHGKVVIEKLKL